MISCTPCQRAQHHQCRGPEWSCPCPHECAICGAGYVRPAHAGWCPRIRAWLSTAPPPPVLVACRGNTYSYHLGCRCDDCRRAGAAAERKYRAKRRLAS